MSRISADLAELQNAEAQFKQAYVDLVRTLEALERDLGTHLKEWEGPARKAYEVFVADWHAMARDLSRELDRLHRVIGVSHRNFDSARTANLRMWQV